MTKEEAIKWLEEIVQDTDTYWGSCSKALQKELDEQKQVFLLALSALRPITREQVERVWRGEWEEERFASEHEGWQHRECGRHSTEKTKWCPKCGKAMTDEAVDMVMERLEVMKDGNSVKR